jgi:biotin-dependent carboxylase-like uncharacterized protein
MTVARAIRVTHVVGHVTVQDGGRPGRMHFGVPPGGPLVPEALARANLAVGNDPGAAALEIVGRIGVTAEDALDRRAVVVGTDDGTCHELSPGVAFEVRTSSWAGTRYLAVAGGIDVPIVLGGRGTLRVARLGGLEGRALRVGDLLPAGDVAGGSTGPSPSPSPAGSPSPSTTTLVTDLLVRVIAGPDDDEAAFEALLATNFRLGAATDRVGARLVGGTIATKLTVARSRPMIRGAIQIPSSGEPIILGPDHPTTGGYPVVAVVVTADVGMIYTRSPGVVVSFARVPAPGDTF